MTKSNFAIITSILFGIILLAGCGDSGPEPKTDEEIQIEKLSKIWVLQSGASSATIAGTDVTSVWSGFILTIGDKTYSSSGADNTLVWPTSGTWVFATGDISTVMRDDGVDVSVSVSESSLTLSFNFSSTGGRLNGIDGNWIFKMQPQP